MGNNVDNSYLNKLNETLFKDGWLQDLYGTERANQQSELKKLFTTVSDNNVTKDEKKHLEAQATTLADKVEMLEAKMAVLAETMAKNEKTIQDHVNKIADLINTVKDESKKMQEEQEEWNKKAIEEVFEDYRQGITKKDEIAGEIALRIKNCPWITDNKANIEDALGDLDNYESKISGLVNDTTKWIEQNKILEAQYGCTKSAYDMLQASIAQVGATGTNYTNMDTDTNVPIYSPEKTATVADLLANTAYNVSGGNSAKADGAEAPTPITLEQIKEKHADNLGVAATSGVDKNSASNKAVQALGKALDDGLFEDLVSTGMSFNDIKDFFAENFAGANIKVNDEGKMSIPYGHGADAQEIFNKLDNKVENYNPYQGALNTWDDYGNTIETNPQIGALKQFVADGNFAQLKEQGFTFKEAMYALFDPEKGLFKDTGIVYDLDEQTGEPKYFMQYAGDEKTANLFKEVATQIYDNWGVSFYRGASAKDRESYPTEPIPTTPTPSEEANRTDPLSFHIGNDKNNKYSFIMDRDGDGKFTGPEDFVGGKEGTSWLDDLKTFDADGNGILEGDELKNVKLFGTNYDDNAEEYKENGHVRGERTDVDYHITNASDMGITSINLNDLEGNVNNSTGKYDINDNEVFNDSFTMTMNGQEVEVHRLDETENFMNAIYGDVYGKNFEIGLSEVDADAIMEKDYGEYDDFEARFANLFQNIAILQNVNDIANETRTKYDAALKILNEQNLIDITKANNRAAALKENSSWDRLYPEVLKVVNSKDMALSDADWVQLKGIYMIDGSLNAEEVVAKYQQQCEAEDAVNKSKEASKETFAIMIECVKNGIIPDSEMIMTEILAENPKSAEEIMAILKEKMPDLDASVEIDVTKLDFDTQREEEIFNEFNNAFANAGLGDKVVDALRDLCVDEMNSKKGFASQSPRELAQKYLEKYQAQ